MKTREIRYYLTEGAYKTILKTRKTLILLTFSPWHLNWLYNTKNPTRKSWIFSFVSAGHNIICVQRTQHHLSVSSTSFRGRRTQMNEVALRANDVLRNDVGLRPMKLRFAQTELDR